MPRQALPRAARHPHRRARIAPLSMSQSADMSRGLYLFSLPSRFEASKGSLLPCSTVCRWVARMCRRVGGVRWRDGASEGCLGSWSMAVVDRWRALGCPRGCRADAFRGELPLPRSRAWRRSPTPASATLGGTRDARGPQAVPSPHGRGGRAARVLEALRRLSSGSRLGGITTVAGAVGGSRAPARPARAAPPCTVTSAPT